MKICEEKEHIYRLMRDIVEERRILSEQYFSLKERLDELNKLESKGIEDLSVNGYVDLFNKMSKQTEINNIEREAEHAIGQIKMVLDHKKKEMNKEEERSIIPQNELLRAKEIDSRNKIKVHKEENVEDIGRVKKRISTKMYRDEIVNILQETGRPMKANEIRQKLEDKLNVEISAQSFGTNIMYRVKKFDNKIESASFGYYQYRA